MKISYLSFLVSGVNPDKDGCRILNDSRKETVESFIKKIPDNYSLESIRPDIERIESNKGLRIYSIVENFSSYALVFSAAIFVLYWLLFGFWRAVLTGIILVVLLFFLDKHIGSLVDLSPESEKLIVDFENLVNELTLKQKSENAKKQK